MSSYLRVEVPNAEEVVREMRRLLDAAPETINKASAKAMNRTLRLIKNEAVKIARRTYTANPRSLKKRAKITKATSKRQYACLEIKDRNGIGLINFASRPGNVLSWKGVAPKKRKKFVTNKVRRDGKRRVFNDHGSPFVAEVDNGKHIFYRDGRDKLKRLYGPSLIYALFGAGRELESHADEAFPRLFKEELDKILL